MSENVARKAIEVLAERGWHQGYYHARFRGGTGVCIKGAVSVACGLDATDSTRETHKVTDAIRRVVAEQFPDRYPPMFPGHLTEFNDHPDTTLADVLLVLDKAAVRLDEQVGL